MLADADVSFPLGSTNGELIQIIEDSEAGTPCATEVVVCSCRITESIVAMGGVLEMFEATANGKTVWLKLLLPQETMRVVML